MSGTLSTTQYVPSSSGGSSSDSGTTIVSGGVQYIGDIYGTGTAINTTISSGGLQYVGSGSGVTGYATGVTIDSFGIQYVGYSSGTGTATSTTIASGGLQDVGFNSGTGTATDTTIDSGGLQYVGYGSSGTGTATSTTISGGTQYVGYNSGTGAATNTTIDSGGSQYLGYNSGTGAATSTTIDSGGTQYVGYSSGTGTATNTTISGGVQFVGSNFGTGTATNTTIDSLGVQFVGYSSGTGMATGTTISGGTQFVGDVSGTGTATNTTISGGGTQYVGYGGTGTATSTTIENGGVQVVGYGSATAMATATDTTIDGGGIQVVGSDSAAATATNTFISGGEQLVSSGGTATDTTVFSGGLADILSGGVADTPVIDGGTLQLAAGAKIATGPVAFAAVSGANGGTLDLTGMGTGSVFASDFTAVISGFTGTGGSQAMSDEINVVGAGPGDTVSWSQNGASGTLDVMSGGTVLESMTLDGTYVTSQFVLTNAGSTDEIFYNTSAPCYCPGTLIATEKGEIAVEDLKIGDRLLTASGALRPLKWIGTRSYSARFAGNNPDLLPIRFKAGSVADRVPARDLLVSPKHAMFLDGVLITAKHLVNGATIVQEAPGEDIHYFHLELETHDVLIAEGALSESFVDDDSRGMFQNAHEFSAHYPDERAKEAIYCAPRVEDGFTLDRVRRRLAERAGLAYPAATDFGVLIGAVERCDCDGVSGSALNTGFPDAPVCLDVIVDGVFMAYAYAQAERPDGFLGFDLRFATPLDPSHDHQIQVRRSADGALLGQRLVPAAEAAA